jgi:hypothetical protein
VQVPLLEQVSVVPLHVLHIPPCVPHVVRDSASQTAPLQQPAGHELEVHSHMPPAHTWPWAHIFPPPQVQVPLVHPSAEGVPHDWQATPPTPHGVGDADTRQLPVASQHPVGHEVALHSHLPPRHCWPGLHGVPEPPHSQLPKVQLSATRVLHARQASPPTPHALVERALHVEPEQQPCVQVCVHPVHAPDAQLSPFGHVWHWLPPLPQAPSVLPVWQRPLAQHPVGQVVPSQTQAPLRQRWPATHAPFVPHMQTPAMEHESASSAGHAAHIVPGVAQAASERSVQPSGPQQPFGHDAASQMQAPFRQCIPGLQGALLPHVQLPEPLHPSAWMSLQT